MGSDWRVGIICVVAGLVYGRVVKFGLVVDDIRRYKKDKIANRWKWFLRMFRSSARFGGPMWLEHMMSVIIHVMVCVSIYWVFGRNSISFMASMLFLLHPANTQVSVWMNGKRYGMMTLIVLWGWFFRPWGGLLVVPAMWFQVQGIVLAILCPIGLVTLPLGYGKFMKELKGRQQTMTVSALREIRCKKLIFVSKCLKWYFLRWFYPSRTEFYTPYHHYFGVSKEGRVKGYKVDLDFWVGVLIVMLVIWYSVLIRNLYGLWWLVCMVPYMNFYTVTQKFADRYGYLPNIGLALVSARVLEPYGWVSLVVLGMLTIRTIHTMGMYRDTMRFMDYQTFHSPKSSRGWMYKANTYLKKGDVLRALIVCSDGLEHNPEDFKLNATMCAAYNQLGNKDMAKKHAVIAKENLVEGQEDSDREMLDKVIVALDSGGEAEIRF